MTWALVPDQLRYTRLCADRRVSKEVGTTNWCQCGIGVFVVWRGEGSAALARLHATRTPGHWRQVDCPRVCLPQRQSGIEIGTPPACIEAHSWLVRVARFAYPACVHSPRPPHSPTCTICAAIGDALSSVKNVREVCTSPGDAVAAEGLDSSSLDTSPSIAPPVCRYDFCHRSTRFLCLRPYRRDSIWLASAATMDGVSSMARAPNRGWGLRARERRQHTRA